MLQPSTLPFLIYLGAAHQALTLINISLIAKTQSWALTSSKQLTTTASEPAFLNFGSQHITAASFSWKVFTQQKVPFNLTVQLSQYHFLRHFASCHTLMQH